MNDAKNDVKSLLRLPPKKAVRAGLTPAEGNDAYVNVANSAVDNAPPASTLPRFLANTCALHHISEKVHPVVIRTDEAADSEMILAVTHESASAVPLS